MTALTKYQKLESSGLWRELPEAQRREVVVNLGDASLVLSDPRSETALTHWSLPAVRRLNPGTLPALYSPGEDAAETLELQDADMIAALDTVRAAIARAKPHPGRLRGAIVGSTATMALALAIFWLPGALIRNTASVLPPATRAEVGRLALADLTRITGAPCSAPAGRAALDKLALRVFGAKNTPKLIVVREGLERPVHLPGRQVVLPEPLVALPDGPEVVAGAALVEGMRIDARDPMIAMLRHAGVLATLRLLATGTLGRDAVAGFAEALIALPAPAINQSSVIERFRDAEVPTGPYAATVDPGAQVLPRLATDDPFPGGAPRTILTDEEWISLQDICTR